MKKIIYTLAIVASFSLLNTKASAQINPSFVVSGTYYQDEDLNKYIGTWKWTGDNEEFLIILSKKKIARKDYTTDVLYGGYRYIKNGKEVVNTLNDADNNPPPIQSFERDGGFFAFYFFDKAKNNKRGYLLSDVKLQGRTYTMTWNLSNDGSWIMTGEFTDEDTSFSVPEENIVS